MYGIELPFKIMVPSKCNSELMGCLGRVEEYPRIHMGCITPIIDPYRKLDGIQNFWMSCGQDMPLEDEKTSIKLVFFMAPWAVGSPFTAITCWSNTHCSKRGDQSMDGSPPLYAPHLVLAHPGVLKYIVIRPMRTVTLDRDEITQWLFNTYGVHIVETTLTSKDPKPPSRVTI